MAAPETRPSGDQGDVDIVFNVKEKRTGNVNFGASMGQGTGIGGFIGLDQPNLLGRCKRAQVQFCQLKLLWPPSRRLATRRRT